MTGGSVDAGTGRRSATIADVATLAAVSIQTVSRVVNRHPSVAPGTRQRVEQAILQLAYRPNSAARALVHGASRGFGPPGVENQRRALAEASAGAEEPAGAYPTGKQFELRAGTASAVITEVGGGLRTLAVNGRNLVAGFSPGEIRPVYRGSVLAPWPNRVAAGWYVWDRREQRLPLTEPDRGNALHGLACWLTWVPVTHRADFLSLTTRIWPQPGYPYQLDLTVTYELDGDGLQWRLEARNSGTEAAPYGCSVHPYLVAGPGTVDDWSLALPADRFMQVDRARLLPLELRPVDSTSFDFRAARTLSDEQIDHAFTGLTPDDDGIARVIVRSPEGGGVAMEWDAAVLPWLQVHTADRAEPALHRSGLAVEPMTCPPNALQTGQSLIRLEPGETHTAWWRIRAL